MNPWWSASREPQTSRLPGSRSCNGRPPHRGMGLGDPGRHDWRGSSRFQGLACWDERGGPVLDGPRDFQFCSRTGADCGNDAGHGGPGGQPSGHCDSRAYAAVSAHAWSRRGIFRCIVKKHSAVDPTFTRQPKEAAVMPAGNRLDQMDLQQTRELLERAFTLGRYL